MTLDKNKIKKVTTPIKPSAGKRIQKIDIKYPRIPGVPEGFLNAPIPDWTDPAQLAVGNSKNQQLARYGVNCCNYSRTYHFTKSFKDQYNARLARLENENLKTLSRKLARRGAMNAAEITEQSMESLKNQTLQHIENDNGEETHDEVNQEKGMSEDEISEDEYTYEDDDVENNDNFIQNFDDDETISGPLSELYHSPHKPKLTNEQLRSAQSRCHIGFSGMLEVQMHQHIRSVFQKHKSEQEILATLTSFPQVKRFLIELMCENVPFDDFPEKLWGMRTQSKEWEDATAKDIFRFIALSMTDFWGMSSRNNFEKKHERSFWVESVVPIFKYMAVTNNLIVFSWCESLVKTHCNSQIVPGIWKNTTKKLFADGLGRNNDCDIIVMESSSGYSKENIDHSMEDTWKLILMMTDSLRNELMKYQGAKFTDAQELATFGIQCICDRITLIKATMFDARRWQIIEVRSAKIPITWDDRSNYMQVFELIATLHIELLAQESLKKLLKEQNNHIIEVESTSTVRYCIRDSNLFEL
ncbi:hypothetical protein INT45_008433 [Circinella minor]|uniref:Uncharacterized protein n=1 Tax=Circinella minor TaxID=1195481 RepID=A0A8H7SBE0_9FUNG|nr:hypothetical protein INT45_008433 [Circinella minor]